MLERWTELFPNVSFCTLRDGNLSDGAIRERLLQEPCAWAQLMRELCVAEYTEEEDDPTEILFSQLTDTVRDAPEDVWDASWEGGFLLVWSEIMRGKFLCGFTREQLVSTSTRSDRTWARILGMMHMFLACFGQTALVSDQAHEQTLDVLHNAVLGVYSSIWDIKDSLRFSESPTGDDTASKSDIAALRVGKTDDLYGTLVKLGHYATVMLRGQRSVKPLDTRIPHIFLFIWIHADSASVRAQALNHLSVVDDPETDAWPAFLANAVSGCTDGEHVLKAIKRDLTNEGTLDTVLDDVYLLFHAWYSFRADARLYPSERQITMHCLAAARRQLCRGDEARGEMSIDSALEVFSQGLRRGMETSQRQLFAWLDLLCHFMMLQLSRNEESPPPQLTDYIEYTLPHLASLARDNRSKTVTLRRHTLAAWQAVSDEARRRQLPRRHAAWRAFMRLWISVKALLPGASADEQPAQFGVLERCEWAECLCSRYKPAHRMRLCQGCERVVYCGQRCQKNDWETGGHRQRCCRVAR